MSKSIKTYHKHKSLEVTVGELTIGGDQPVRVQSMTNTNTLDTRATVDQVFRLADAGCDIVRITAPSIKEAENLYAIKKELRKSGCGIPLVADIHFTPKPAEIAARLVEKVRINPGNYVDRNRGKVDWSAKEIEESRERIAERLIPLLKICNEHGTAIRIGTNHGSLSERILSMYGNTARGMVESAMEFVHICHDYGFHNLVLSMKASNVNDMIAANLMLVDQMISKGFYYPVHLGVTEAGNGEEARIKSAAGIGGLLAMGIGDTVRVSLAEPPVEEVPVGKKLVEHFARRPDAVEQIFQNTSLILPEANENWDKLIGEKYPVLSKSNNSFADLFLSDDRKYIHSNEGLDHLAYATSSYLNYKDFKKGNAILTKSYPDIESEELLLLASTEFSVLYQHYKKAGIWLKRENDGGGDDLAEMSLKILQGLGLRFTKAEFVACPSCGRTKFNLFESFNKVKERTAHLTGLRIAVMGCIVNGPGEMGDADYGYVGAGPGKVTLYKNGVAVMKNLDEEKAVMELVELINESGDWVQPE